MEIPQSILEKAKGKVIKRNTLFPLIFNKKLLDEKKCPLCGRKYKVMMNGNIYCNKHKPQFFMRANHYPVK